MRYGNAIVSCVIADFISRIPHLSKSRKKDGIRNTTLVLYYAREAYRPTTEDIVAGLKEITLWAVRSKIYAYFSLIDKFM